MRWPCPRPCPRHASASGTHVAWGACSLICRTPHGMACATHSRPSHATYTCVAVAGRHRHTRTLLALDCAVTAGRISCILVIPLHFTHQYLTPYATCRFATATNLSVVLQICRCYNTLHQKRNNQNIVLWPETLRHADSKLDFCRLPKKTPRTILHNLQKQAWICSRLQNQACFCRKICGWRTG